MAAYLLPRGKKTLHLHVRQRSESALRIARYLLRLSSGVPGFRRRVLLLESTRATSGIMVSGEADHPAALDFALNIKASAILQARRRCGVRPRGQKNAT
jgi:hypothetical protein